MFALFSAAVIFAVVSLSVALHVLAAGTGYFIPLLALEVVLVAWFGTWVRAGVRADKMAAALAREEYASRAVARRAEHDANAAYRLKEIAYSRGWEHRMK